MREKGPRGRWSRLFGVFAVLAAALLFARPAAADTVYVDCRQNPSPGDFASITAAINSLTTTPPTWDPWHYVLLRSDCVENVTINRPDIYIAPEWDRCPWSGCPPPSNTAPARIIAARSNAAVVAVSGPVDVTLVHLSLSGGAPGLAVDGNASATTYGVVAEQNQGAGVTVNGGASLTMNEGGTRNNGGEGLVVGGGGSVVLYGAAASLRNTPVLVSGNGKMGIRLDRGHLSITAGTVIEANQGWGLLSYGGDTTFGGCCGTEVAVQGNQGGAFLTEGSEASFWGRTAFRENGSFGVYVEAGSHATFYQNETTGQVSVEGHLEAGVNVTGGSQASFHGANKVRSNGAANRPWSAGVRVDGRSSAFFDQGQGNGPTEVSGNTGAGILVDLGSGLDAPEVLVSGNSREAVRVRRQSVALLGAGAGLQGNGWGPLACDGTSLVITEVVKKGAECSNVEKVGEVRPDRPALQP